MIDAQTYEQMLFQRFRSVLCDNPDGRWVLSQIMRLGSFWVHNDTEEQRIERNFVMKILGIMQITRGDLLDLHAENIANEPVLPVYTGGSE